MATINISDLRSTGSDLFSDSESYMGELSEYELSVQGGGTPAALIIAGARASSVKCKVAVASAVAGAASYIKGRFL